MIIADTLSHAHLSEEGEEIPEEELDAQIHMVMEHCVESDEMEEIKAATKDDETLQEVIKYTKEGWPLNPIPTGGLLLEQPPVEILE